MRLALVAAALTVLATRDATADPHTCVYADTDIAVDGMLDDWDGIAKVTGGTGNDRRLDLYCTYDDKRMALAFDVRDELIIRVKKGPATEDRVELDLGAGAGAIKLVLYPGNATARPRRTLGTGRVPSWLAVEDTLQPKGFSIELVIPLARIPGYSTATPAIKARAVFKDSDRATGKTTDDVVLDLQLELATKKNLMADFLRAVRAKPTDVSLDVQADVDRGRRGKERVVVAGTALGVLAEQFVFVTLPVAGRADILEVKPIDLRGDGSRLIAARIRQHGNGGSRELLTLFGVHSGQVAPVLSIEIKKQLGSATLASTWKIATTKVKRKKRIELVVEAGPSTGFDPNTYDEPPANDAEPINLPWDDDRYGTAFWFEAGEVKQRMIPRPKPRR